MSFLDDVESGSSGKAKPAAFLKPPSFPGGGSFASSTGMPKPPKGGGSFLDSVKTPDEGTPSLVEQLKNQLMGIPQGVAGLATGGVKALGGDANPFGAALNYAHGEDGLALARKASQAAADASPDKSAVGQLKARFTAQDPTLAGILDSIQRTGGDVIHPSRFKDASDKGQLVGKITEDLANAALIGGPILKGVSSVAGAAAEGGGAAARLAGAIAKGAETAAPFVEHPIGKPLSAGLEAAAGAAPAGSAIGRGLLGTAHFAENPLTFTAGSIGDRLSITEGKGLTALANNQEAHPVLGKLAQTVQDAVANHGPRVNMIQYRDANNALMQEHELSPMAAASKEANTAVENQAIIGKIAGIDRQAEGVVQAVQAGRLPESEGRAFVDALNDPKVPAGDRFTYDGAKLAYDRRMGTLPAEDLARLDNAEGLFRESLARRQERALQGVGTTDGSKLNPAQLLHQPLADVVEAKIAPHAAKVEAQRGVAEAAAGKAQTAAERQAEVQANEAQRLKSEAAVHKADAQTLKAGQAQQATERAAQLHALADIKDQQAQPRPIDPSLPAHVQGRMALQDAERVGKATAEAKALREQAKTLEKATPDSRRIAVLETKAKIKESQAARVLAGQDPRPLAAEPKTPAEEARAATSERAAKFRVVQENGPVSIARRQASEAQSLADREGGKLETAYANLGKKTGEARLSLEAAPAQDRPALAVGARADDYITKRSAELTAAGDHETAAALQSIRSEVAQNLDDLNRLGYSRDIQHVMTGVAKAEDAGSTVRLKGESAPALRKTSSQIERRTTDVPMTFHDVARNMSADLRKAVGNMTVKMMAEKYGTTAESLGLDHLTGEALQQAMKDRYRMEPWQVVGGDSKYLSSTTDGSTVFIPSSLAREFQGWTRSRWKVDEALSLTFDKGTQAFKTSVLPFSAHFHLGHVSGHTLLVAASAGMDPITFLRYVKEGRAYMKSGEFTGPLATWEAQAVRGGGMGHALAGVQVPVDKPGLLSQARAVLGTPMRKSWDYTRLIDDYTRQAVYLWNLDKPGFNPERAMKETLHTLGDFHSMTAVERATFARILPFWSWTKQVTRIAFQLPFEHPYRVAWMMNLANLGGGAKMQADLPDWLKGSIPLSGDKVLKLAFLNPFDKLAEPIFTPKGALKAVNPLLKLGAAVGLNRNLEDLKPLTAPPGTDDSMHPLGVKAALTKAVQFFPQGRTLLNIPGQQVSRYQNTEPVLRNGAPVDATPAVHGVPGALASLFAVPVPTYGQSASSAARSASYTAKQAKLRGAYDAKLAKGAAPGPRDAPVLKRGSGKTKAGSGGKSKVKGVKAPRLPKLPGFSTPRGPVLVIPKTTKP